LIITFVNDDYLVNDPSNIAKIISQPIIALLLYLSLLIHPIKLIWI